MICPRCHTCHLDEKDRQGVQIDVWSWWDDIFD
jgi:hypothetical protein